MKTLFSYSVFFSLFFSACFLSCGDNIWSDATAKRVQHEIDSTLQQYHKDIEEKGLMADLSYLDSTDMFAWIPPGFNAPLCYDSIISMIRERAPAISKIELSWDTLSIAPVSRINGIYIAEITSITTDTSGHTDTQRLKEDGTLIK